MRTALIASVFSKGVFRLCLTGLVLTAGLLFIPWAKGDDGVGKSRHGAPAQTVPRYYEVMFSSLEGEILVNLDLTGPSVVARPISARDAKALKVEKKVDSTGGDWAKITVPKTGAPPEGLVVTGRWGTIKVTFQAQGSAGAERSGALRALGDLVIKFGGLASTLVISSGPIAHPAGMEIAVLERKRSRLISGEIIAVSGDEIAFEFSELPTPDVLGKQGTARISIKKPDGSIQSGTISAWGYDVFVDDVNVGKPSKIKAKVYGLSDGESVRFSFNAVRGQVVIPPSGVHTVKSINSGAPIAEISTAISGFQPLSVEAVRVE